MAESKTQFKTYPPNGSGYPNEVGIAFAHRHPDWFLAKEYLQKEKDAKRREAKAAVEAEQ